MGIRETSITDFATATLLAPDAVDGWRARLRIAAYALYRQLREHPAHPVQAEIEELVDLIDAGREEPASPTTLTRVTAEALGGAISRELFFAACAGSPPFESELVPTLMYAAVLPYTGAAGADEELRIPPPPDSLTG
jgi:AcrR family transcriptional regulator